MKRKTIERKYFLGKDERINFHDKQPRINRIILSDISANEKEIEDLIGYLEKLVGKVPIKVRGSLNLSESEIIGKAEGDIGYLKEIYRAITGKDYQQV